MIVLILLGTACQTTGSNVDRSHGIAMRKPELRGPGTALGDGLRVPAGAALAGAALPGPAVQFFFKGDPVRARSWTAVLGVGGSPSKVAGALLRQARRARFPNLPPRIECAPNGSSPPEGQTSATTYPPGGTGQSETSEPSTCRFRTAFWPVDRPPTGRALRVEITRVATLGTWGVVEFADYGGRDGAPQPDEPLRFPPLDVRAYPRAPTTLPKTGGEIGIDGPPFAVVEGSAAMLPTLPVDVANWTSLLVVTGDPQDVFDAYASRLRRNLGAATGPRLSDNGEPRFSTRRERRGKWRVHAISGDDGAPDGAAETVELFTLGNQAYIRIHATNG